MNHVRPTYPYQRSKDQTLAQRARHPVIVVGAGPIGLTAAIDLKLRGIPVVLLDEDNTSSEGSRAIAYARRTLQIWDRLGCVEGMLARGVQWTSGKVFWGEKKVYEYGMGSGRSEEAFPPFLNLQQYHVEEQLVQRCIELGVDLRWNNRVTGLDNQPGGPVLKVATPDGEYELACDWLLAADGASSTVRRQLGLSFQGKVFDEKFLICDVRMRSDFPPERWFWFDPPFNRGQSALLHMQADGVWRVGMQLGVRQEDSFDAEREKSPERVVPRLRAMLGEKTDFELIWSSIYTFKCRRLEQFRAGRVLFIGDSAHQVSPFGGRGANSGVQDVDNLGWKLQLVLQGLAPESLIDSYHEERSVAADENILHSTRATDFITPKNRAAVLYRDAVLGLATRHAFARALINSGRPSAPTTYADSCLNTNDGAGFEGGPRPGSPCPDVNLATDEGGARLLSLSGEGFVGLSYGAKRIDASSLKALAEMSPPVRLLEVAAPGESAAVVDEAGELARQYAMRPGDFYLLRPDQHVAGRWRRFEQQDVARALHRACAQEN